MGFRDRDGFLKSACLALLAAAVPAGAGCRRQAPPPSAHYEKGAILYQQLYATELDDAYGDPRMETAVAELKLVEKDSLDAAAAEELLGTIARGKAEFAKSQAERARAQSQIAALAPRRSNIDPEAVLNAGRKANAAVDPTGTGASVADLNAQSGGCLVSDQPFREEGTGKTGTLYKLAPSPACQERLPGFVGQAVMVTDGKVYRRVPASETRTEPSGLSSAGTPSPPRPAPTPPASGTSN